MPDIHPTAVISTSSILGEGIKVGPFCVIGDHVRLGNGCVLHSHVVLEGHITAGNNNTFYPFTSIGHPPQDLKFKGEKSEITIGDDNIFREYVTVNPGTAGDALTTVIGSGCLFMIGSHIAHDCRVGDKVILANNATLAGHVHVGSHTVIGGLAAVHQFVRIGDHAMIGGLSGIEHDIIPFGQAVGERATLAGLNLVGMKRRGFQRETIKAIRDAFETIFREDGNIPLKERSRNVSETYTGIQEIQDMVDFVAADSDRGLCRPRNITSAAKPAADEAA